MNNLLEIPLELVEALKPYGLKRFIRVAKNGKKAIDTSWPDAPLSLEDKQLEEWAASGGNYGVLAGQGIIIIDLDERSLAEKLPETFTVETGRGGLHLYYRSDVVENGIIEKDLVNLGHIQVKRKYVVGPNSTHPNGKRYKVVRVLPITWISKKELEDVLGDSLRWSGIEKFIPQAKSELDAVDASITQVVSMHKLRRHGLEHQGAHPLHGSTTGQNFCVNTNKNVWHCFRHGSGGGPLMFVAMAEGILSCDECKPGALKGLKYVQTIKIAEEKYNFKIRTRSVTTESGETEYFTVDGKFQPVWFAKDLMAKHYFKTVKDNETVYVYNSTVGVYLSEGEITIKQEMATRLDDDTRQHFYNDILFYIKGKTFFDRPKTAVNKIVVFNGVLNIGTMKLEPFSKEEFLTIQIPIHYDTDARCPKILKFIEEVVGKDQLTLIQEWIGYCLHLGYPLHKAVMLIGEGANGKSTLINLIRTFLGKDNVSEVTLQQLCTHRFSAALLYNKLANLCADLPPTSLKKTGMFKMLTGGDTVTGEEKWKTPFSFRNHAKIMFSANKIPQTEDDTIAFFRRWIIIVCNRYFSPDVADPHILEKICTPTELSGLLNWALEGLQKLMENADFTDNKTWEEQREQYILSSNSAQAFIETHVSHSKKATDTITKETLYTTYLNFCKQKRLPSMKKAELTKNMQQFCPGAQETQIRVAGKQKKAWKFVSVTAVTSLLFNQKKSIEKLKELNRDEVTEVTPSEKECSICLKPLPADLFDCTVYKGEECHTQCYLRLKNRLEEEDM